MTNVRAVLLCSTIATAVAAGQGVVQPVEFTAAEGNYTNHNPWGDQSGSAHYLQIHDFVPGDALPIIGLAFRRNGRDQNAYPAYSLDLVLSLAPALTTAAAPLPTFTANHARATTIVFNGRIDFPATNQPAALPAPFHYRIPFAVPFPWSGGALCWDAEIRNSTLTTRLFFDAVDAASAIANPLPEVTVVGTGCVASGQTLPLQVGGGVTMDWPNGSMQLTFACQRGPASGVGLAMIGFTAASFLGLPLPFTLPGTTGFPSGSCAVLNDGQLFLGGLWSGGTFVAGPLTVPITPLLHGGTIYHQVLGFDAGANSLGVVTSASAGRQLIAPWGPAAIGRVSTSGTVGNTGQTQGNSGLVTCFVH